MRQQRESGAHQCYRTHSCCLQTRCTPSPHHPRATPPGLHPHSRQDRHRVTLRHTHLRGGRQPVMTQPQRQWPQCSYSPHYPLSPLWPPVPPLVPTRRQPVPTLCHPPTATITTHHYRPCSRPLSRAWVSLQWWASGVIRSTAPTLWTAWRSLSTTRRCASWVPLHWVWCKSAAQRSGRNPRPNPPLLPHPNPPPSPPSTPPTTSPTSPHHHHLSTTLHPQSPPPHPPPDGGHHNDR